jgi:hypothetical protein
MNIQPMRIQGGVKPAGLPIYCGSKPNVPRGKVRGRPNQCFMAGRRAGFYAGVLRGQAGPQPAQQQAQPFTYITLEEATNDILKGILMRSGRYRVGQVRAMDRDRLFNIFRNELNITRIPVPNI